MGGAGCDATNNFYGLILHPTGGNKDEQAIKLFAADQTPQA